MNLSNKVVPPGKIDLADTSSDILQVRDVTANFVNGHGVLQVLNQISISVKQTEFLSIIGPSGSGKSTLLRILAGLLPPSTGQVWLDGKIMDRPRKGIGFVFQNANLMPWRTVVENIRLPLEIQNTAEQIAQKTAQELVDLVGLKGFADTLPRDLSGGMAQRVAIARALAYDPKILFLDEPFGALDAITRERMGNELLRIWQIKKKTIIMVTHDISEALYLSDRVLVFSDRPAEIKLDMRVDLPRPREEAMRYTPGFGGMAKQLRQMIAWD
ncbi:MAG: ABC transporter ATP-binding protein [Chloroflexota bacterium]